MMTIHLNGDGTTMLDDSIKYNIQPDVFDNDIIMRAVEDIEGVYKIEGLALYSREYGVKSPENLSNGMKALLLFTRYGKNNYTELISNAVMGANCAKYLQELTLHFDFHIAWDYFLALDRSAPINAIDYDTGTVFTTGNDVLEFYSGRAGVH